MGSGQLHASGRGLRAVSHAQTCARLARPSFGCVVLCAPLSCDCAQLEVNKALTKRASAAAALSSTPANTMPLELPEGARRNQLYLQLGADSGIDEETRNIRAYEHAFQQIRGVTGVSDVSEVRACALPPRAARAAPRGWPDSQIRPRPPRPHLRCLRASVRLRR